MLINIHECSISVMYGTTIDQSTVQIQKVICIAGHMTSISANEITMTNTVCPHKDSIWFWSNSAYIHSKPFNFTFLKSICILPGKSVSNYRIVPNQYVINYLTDLWRHHLMLCFCRKRLRCSEHGLWTSSSSFHLTAALTIITISSLQLNAMFILLVFLHLYNTFHIFTR